MESAAAFGHKFSTEILECSDTEEVEETTSKPRIEEFLQRFEEQIRAVNETYQNSKKQFESDMKSFNEKDIQQEEELIEKSINEGSYYPLHKEAHTPAHPPDDSDDLEDKHPLFNNQNNHEINPINSDDLPFESNNQFSNEHSNPPHDDLQLRKVQSFVPKISAH